MPEQQHNINITISLRDMDKNILCIIFLDTLQIVQQIGVNQRVRTQVCTISRRKLIIGLFCFILQCCPKILHKKIKSIIQKWKAWWQLSPCQQFSIGITLIVIPGPKGLHQGPHGPSPPQELEGGPFSLVKYSLNSEFQPCHS